MSRLRIIADADYTPVALTPAVNPIAGRPTDLTFSVLRSVSPIHLEYMRNMGTASSMSISIVREGRLWGLISCHHKTPKNVPFDVRTACDLLAQVYALQLSAKERAEGYEYRVHLKGVLSKLLAYMAGEADFVDALASRPAELLELCAAQGAAVVAEGRTILLGQTPSEAEVKDLVRLLAATVTDEVFSTEMLSSLHPNARSFKEQASGLLGISISKFYQSYILWFRPEVIKDGEMERRPA